MHQKDSSIVWVDDAEACTEAIKALSLDIDKNQKGDKSMTSKVKVMIEHENGYRKELSGDTVICFSISGAREFTDGKAQHVDSQSAFIGCEIPVSIYPHTIGSLVASMVEKTSDGKVRAGFDLHYIAEILEAESKKIKNSLTDQEKKESLEDALKHLFGATFSK